MVVRNSWSVMACMCLLGAVACHKSSSPSASTIPVITDFTPKSGPVGTTVTLTGSGYNGTTNVSVGAAISTFSRASDGQLSLTVPTDAATGVIGVVNALGSGGSGSSFYVTPTVTSISPTSGAPGTTVTLTGTGLLGVTKVMFGTGAATAFYPNNANQLQAVVPLVAATGPITVTAANSATTTVTATSPNFTFSNGGAAAPKLTSFSPAQAAAGDDVTLTGTDFTYVTAVTIGGVNCYSTPTSATSLTVQVPPAAVSGLITVTSGLGTDTSATPLTVIPAIAAFTPASGPAGTLVALQGSGFTGTTAIAFGGTPASSFIVLDANNAKANVAAGSTTGPITLVSSALTATSAANFTFVPDSGGAPVITTVLPVEALTGATLTLSGTGLASVTDVFVGNVPDAAAVITSAKADGTELKLIVPANAQSGFITASTGTGASTASAGTFKVDPTITALSAASGSVGATITITGTGFVGTTQVTFGGSSPARFAVDGPNRITAQVPADATTGKVQVTSSGVPCQSAATFTVN